MEIIHEEKNGIACLAIKGRMDAAMAVETEKAIDKVLAVNNRLIFDLSGLEYLSSYGLRIILKAAKKVRLKEGNMILCCLIDNVREIFDVCGFGANIPIADSLESGLAALG